jgi:PPOX class probable F420-dependent enzyme
MLLMTPKLDDAARKLIEAKNFAHIATVRPDGSAAVTPVWIDLEDGLLRINSAEGRAWPEHLRRDPRITINVMNLENPYEYVTIRGRVVDDTHDSANEHIDQLSRKYLGQDYPYRQPGEQRVTFRIEPERVKHQAA